VFDPVLAIAASPRDWPRRLYRHVAEHGGAQVRGTVLDREEALTESSDVLVVDDITSFLDEDLVRALHGQGRHVLGVHESAWGRGRLVRLGVDATIERDAPVEEFLVAATTLSARSMRGLFEVNAWPRDAVRTAGLARVARLARRAVAQFSGRALRRSSVTRHRGRENGENRLRAQRGASCAAMVCPERP
jgi:hypothetical protein